MMSFGVRTQVLTTRCRGRQFKINYQNHAKPEWYWKESNQPGLAADLIQSEWINLACVIFERLDSGQGVSVSQWYR